MDEEYTVRWSKGEKVRAAILIVLIIALVGFLCWGVFTGRFKSDDHSSQCTQADGGITVCEVKQPNDETITCAQSFGGTFGGRGISCDWGGNHTTSQRKGTVQ